MTVVGRQTKMVIMKTMTKMMGPMKMRKSVNESAKLVVKSADSKKNYQNNVMHLLNTRSAR